MLQNTWKRIPRSKVNPDYKIIKGTWVFKLKSLVDGTPSKYRTRFYARGDIQTEEVEYFETYSPVVQWSTIRTLFTLILVSGWDTK